MRLIEKSLGLDLLLEEGHPYVVVIERQDILAVFVGKIFYQMQEGTGDFILSDENKELKLSQRAECITDPFSVDCNEKKIVTKLYQQLKEYADESMQEELGKLNSCIITYLDNLIMQAPYNIVFDLETDILSLFKSYHVGIESDPANLLEKLCDYLKAKRRVCGVDVMIFIGIRQYLTDDEIKRLYQLAAYEKVYLLMIENRAPQSVLETERQLIIDDDMCMINIS